MKKGRQQVLVGKRVADGVNEAHIRREDGRVVPGTVTEPKLMRTLQPSHELVAYRERPGEWCDVETLYRHPSNDEPPERKGVEAAESGTLSGPPQVATPAYRAGYDRIFGKKPEVGIA